MDIQQKLQNLFTKVQISLSLALRVCGSLVEYYTDYNGIIRLVLDYVFFPMYKSGALKTGKTPNCQI
jgi:hypothetical protein